MCSFRSCVARGSCKSHGWCILIHAHHAVSTPSVDNSNASSLCLESCGRLAQTLATGSSSQTPRHPSQIPCPRHRCSTAGERFPLPLQEALPKPQLSSAIPERAGLNRYQLQLFVSFLTTMTGCNPELSIHTQKINTEVLECSHTHVSSRSTSTQEVMRMTRWVTAVAAHVRLWCPLLVECHGCHFLSCGHVFAVTDLIPCCCSLVECLIMALLIMHWPLMTLPLEWISNRDSITQQGHV